MSRELKFRAWDSRACQYWYFGLRDISKDEDGVVIIHTGNPGCVLEVDDPVEQYTELHDADGREIWEGDILGWEIGVANKDGLHIEVVKEVVSWEISTESEVYGHGDTGESERSGFYFEGYYGTVEECKVIGNINENPEMIGGGAK